MVMALEINAQAENMVSFDFNLLRHGFCVSMAQYFFFFFRNFKCAFVGSPIDQNGKRAVPFRLVIRFL